LFHYSGFLAHDYTIIHGYRYCKMFILCYF